MAFKEFLTQSNEINEGLSIDKILSVAKTQIDEIIKDNKLSNVKIAIRQAKSEMVFVGDKTMIVCKMNIKNETVELEPISSTILIKY